MSPARRPGRFAGQGDPGVPPSAYSTPASTPRSSRSGPAREAGVCNGDVAVGGNAGPDRKCGAPNAPRRGSGGVTAKSRSPKRRGFPTALLCGAWASRGPAERPPVRYGAGGAKGVRDLVGDEVLDALLEQSGDAGGGT